MIKDMITYYKSIYVTYRPDVTKPFVVRTIYSPNREFSFSNECKYHVVLSPTNPTVGIVVWINNISELTHKKAFF